LKVDQTEHDDTPISSRIGYNTLVANPGESEIRNSRREGE